MWKTDFLQIIKEFIKFLIKTVWITLKYAISQKGNTYALNLQYDTLLPIKNL